jgi:nickel transport protein
MNKKWIFIISFFLIFFLSKPSFAHKVSIFAYREGDKIIGESYFSGGSPCMNCQIVVYDAKGNKIASTTTDKKGNFQVSVKEKGTVIVKVIAGEGHLAEYTVEGISEENTFTESETEAESEEVTTPSEAAKSKGNKSKISGIDEETLKKIVKEVVAEETAGIKAMLLEFKKDMDKAKIHDIIGGIGYIFGVWGLIALLRTRRKV